MSTSVQSEVAKAEAAQAGAAAAKKGWGGGRGGGGGETHFGPCSGAGREVGQRERESGPGPDQGPRHPPPG